MIDPAGGRPVLRRHFSQALLDGARTQSWLMLLRFGAVGLVNTAFAYAVFAVLVLAGVGPLVALLGSALASIAFNFQTSSRLVFRASGRTVRFVAMYLVLLLANWAALRALNGLGLPELWAQAVLALPIAAASFICQKVFVFGPAGDQV